MAAKFPEIVYRTMKERFVYDGVKNSGLIMGLPAYVENGYYTDEACVREIERLTPDLQADVAWIGIEAAHDAWRSQLETLMLFSHEDCTGYLNAFTRLELAGPEVYNIWARHFRRLFGRMGFSFDSAFEMNGYEQQLMKMEEMDFGHSLFLSNTYAVNRRRFVVESGLSGIDSLLLYVLDTSTDVLGVVHGAATRKCPSAAKIASEISYKMYIDPDDKSLSFRVARDILRANNGWAPLEW